MNPDQSHIGAEPLSSGRSSSGERERILAAVGWEADPRRRKVACDLLREHCRDVYFHYYAATRSRSSAMDRTRRTLLAVARSLDSVPAGCPLAAWIFLRLQEERGIKAECPEPWRLLAGGQSGETDSARGRHLDTHPGCRSTVDEFNRYRELANDEDILIRSGWKVASQDLERYLAAQFNDEGREPASGSNWKRHLPSLRWARSRAVALMVGVAAVVLVALLIRAWHIKRETNWIGGTGLTGLAVPTALPRTGPAPEPIGGARMRVEGHDLQFRWDQARGAESYRLVLLTAKLDTLSVADHLERPGARLPISSVTGLQPNESYLFCVDGVREGKVFASTGFTPFRYP